MKLKPRYVIRPPNEPCQWLFFPQLLEPEMTRDTTLRKTYATRASAEADCEIFRSWRSLNAPALDVSTVFVPYKVELTLEIKNTEAGAQAEVAVPAWVPSAGLEEILSTISENQTDQNTLRDGIYVLAALLVDRVEHSSAWQDAVLCFVQHAIKQSTAQGDVDVYYFYKP